MSIHGDALQQPTGIQENKIVDKQPAKMDKKSV